MQVVAEEVAGDVESEGVLVLASEATKTEAEQVNGNVVAGKTILLVGEIASDAMIQNPVSERVICN